jgi:glyoxylate reductase
MARCFVTRRIPGGALDRLSAEHDVDLWEERLPPPPEELIAHASQAEGLLTQLTDWIDAEVIAACPRLRAIANYAVGYENIDVDAATARGIAVGNTPGVLTETTADLAFALLLASARRLVEADGQVRRGDWVTWEPEGLLGQDVHGATLGIVGFGRIGKAVARRGEGFGMSVLHHSRSGGVPLRDLLERSDFVSLHAPLTPETRGLIGEDELRLMKPTAILVNTARGQLVHTDALTRALREGWIGGAALDVTDPEPLPADHPLLAAPNLTITPHVGSDTAPTREAMADMAVDNLLAALAGRPMPNGVNAIPRSP